MANPDIESVQVEVHLKSGTILQLDMEREDYMTLGNGFRYVIDTDSAFGGVTVWCGRMGQANTVIINYMDVAAIVLAKKIEDFEELED